MASVGLEGKVADVLASFREALGVSRARCYAMEPSGSFRLAASYGFVSRFGPEEVLNGSDPLIEWVQHHRKPVFANSPQEAGPLSRVMEREQYFRVLAAPIYSGSRLIGILELQDKRGGYFFGSDDTHRVARVVERLASLLAGSDAGATVAAPDPIPFEDAEALFLQPPPTPPTRFPPPPPLFYTAAEPVGPQPAPHPLAVPRPSSVSSPPAGLTRPEILLIKGFFHALLLNPDLEAVVFSLWGRERAEIHLGSRRPFSEAGREELVRNLEKAFGAAVPGAVIPPRKEFHVELALPSAPGHVEAFPGVQTSVIFSESETLLLSAVFARPPASESDQAWKETHRLVRATILQLRGGERYRSAYRSFVNILLEPGRQIYPQLKAHSLSVASLARRLATAIGLPPETVEQFTVAALLHDIGLRELDLTYERIAGRRPLGLEDIEIVRQHAAVGAALIGRIEFPYPVAPLVRHHHERFDGAGYPDRLIGQQIPLGARVIGIAEAYDAMTASHSYRSPLTREAALETILLKAGTQFDPELARKFCELVRKAPEAADPAPAGPGA